VRRETPPSRRVREKNQAVYTWCGKGIRTTEYRENRRSERTETEMSTRVRKDGALMRRGHASQRATGQECIELGVGTAGW